MNNETGFSAKKLLLTILLLFSVFFVLAGIQFLGSPLAEKGLKNSAEIVLHSWNNKVPGIGEKLVAGHTGWAFTHIYRTTGKGNQAALVFVVRITGIAGPYTGVFYYTLQSGTVFCGLAGISGPPKPASFYGITNRLVDSWIRKITILAVQSGALK